MTDSGSSQNQETSSSAKGHRSLLITGSRSFNTSFTLAVALPDPRSKVTCPLTFCLRCWPLTGRSVTLVHTTRPVRLHHGQKNRGEELRRHNFRASKPQNEPGSHTYGDAPPASGGHRSPQGTQQPHLRNPGWGWALSQALTPGPFHFKKNLMRHKKLLVQAQLSQAEQHKREQGVSRRAHAISTSLSVGTMETGWTRAERRGGGAPDTDHHV